MQTGQLTSVVSLALVLALVLTAFAVAPATAQEDEKHPIVILDTSMGEITIALYPDKAPITVANFLKYVDDGFYDNLVFHRVIPGFMIQGGGMDEKMNEKKDGLRGRIKNESSNGLSNARGTIAMARTSDPNSATCQFFINHADNDRLDTYGGGYAVFGKVIGGMDVVDKIAKVETTSKGGGHENVPVQAVVIKSAKRKDKK